MGLAVVVEGVVTAHRVTPPNPVSSTAAVAPVVAATAGPVAMVVKAVLQEMAAQVATSSSNSLRSRPGSDLHIRSLGGVPGNPGYGGPAGRGGPEGPLSGFCRSAGRDGRAGPTGTDGFAGPSGLAGTPGTIKLIRGDEPVVEEMGVLEASFPTE